MTGVDAVPSSSNFAAGRGGCAPDSAAARAPRWMPRASTCCIPDRRLPAPWARGMPARFAACRTAARRTQQRWSAFLDRQIPSPAIPSAGQAALTALLRPKPDASCPPDGVVRSPWFVGVSRATRLTCQSSNRQIDRATVKRNLSEGGVFSDKNGESASLLTQPLTHNTVTGNPQKSFFPEILAAHRYILPVLCTSHYRKARCWSRRMSRRVEASIPQHVSKRILAAKGFLEVVLDFQATPTPRFRDEDSFRAHAALRRELLRPSPEVSDDSDAEEASAMRTRTQRAQQQPALGEGETSSEIVTRSGQQRVGNSSSNKSEGENCRNQASSMMAQSCASRRRKPDPLVDLLITVTSLLTARCVASSRPAARSISQPRCTRG